VVLADDRAIPCLAAVALHLGQGVEGFLHRRFTALLTVIAFISAYILLHQIRNDPKIAIPVLFLAAMGLLQATNLRGMRIPLLLAMVVAFCTVSVFRVESS
jgi:hypothetical protein